MTIKQAINITVIITLGLFIILTVGCGPNIGKRGPAGADGSNGEGCHIEGTYLVCPDGSRFDLPVDGVDGVDGKDGKDAALFDIYDPCGDGPGVDEVLLILSDGTILAWYKNTGLAVLDNGYYVTTDSQKCSFRVFNGTVSDD